MNDAGELLLALYERVRAAGAPESVEFVFGLRISESVHCMACNLTTHRSSYTQFFFNAQVRLLLLLLLAGHSRVRVAPLSTLCLPPVERAAPRPPHCANRQPRSPRHSSAALCCRRAWAGCYGALTTLSARPATQTRVRGREGVMVVRARHR